MSAELDPTAVAAASGRWPRAAVAAAGLVPVATDGQSARSSRKATSTGGPHPVSAWAAEARVTLGPVSAPDGSNGIAAIPALPAVPEPGGAIASPGAAGCRADIARRTREGGGGYLLAVGGDRPALRAAVGGVSAAACEADFAGVTLGRHESAEDGQGRHEERYVAVIRDPPGSPADRPGAAAVVRVNRGREADGKRATTTHDCGSSHRGSAAESAALIRGHWGIEGMHWVLDVVDREDDSRARAGHAGANRAMTRKVAASLTRRAPGGQGGVTERLEAGWDDEFLLQVLRGIPAIIVR